MKNILFLSIISFLTINCGPKDIDTKTSQNQKDSLVKYDDTTDSNSLNNFDNQNDTINFSVNNPEIEKS